MTHIRNTEHFIAWLEASGYRNIVLAVGDLLNVLPDWQRIVAAEAMGAHAGRLPDGPRPDVDSLDGAALGELLRNLAVDGYLCLPVDYLAGLDMDRLAALQEAVFAYREYRQAMFKPTVWEVCGCDDPTRCPMCDGRGEVEVCVELSEAEQELARG